VVRVCEGCDEELLVVVLGCDEEVEGELYVVVGCDDGCERVVGCD
jgi:hypothetical protein